MIPDPILKALKRHPGLMRESDETFLDTSDRLTIHISCK